MKRILLIAAVTLMSVAASAQDLKWAYVDFNQLVMLMPKTTEYIAVVEENQNEQNETLSGMYEEYQVKMQEYQQKAQTWSAATRESKEKELMDFQSRFEMTQQSYQQELYELKQNLMSELYEDAQKVVNNLAKEKGVAFVFAQSSLMYFDPAQGLDLTPDARKALKISEDKTIESFEMELQANPAKANAAAVLLR